MQFRLRTLMILLAVVPPLLATGWLAIRWLSQSSDGQMMLWMLTPSIICTTLAVMVVIFKRLILLAVMGRRNPQKRLGPGE